MTTSIKAGSRFSIRKKILLFAVFSALVPSLLLGWIFNYKTHQMMLEKTEHQLLASINRAARELESYFTGRLADLRVFSNSYIVIENSERYLESGLASGSEDHSEMRLKAGEQLNDYLALVQTQVSDYRGLSILDLAGTRIAGDPAERDPIRIPPEQLRQLHEPQMVLILPEQEAGHPEPRLLATVPIQSSHGPWIGILAAEIQLKSLLPILGAMPGMGTAEMFLIGERGDVLLSGQSLQESIRSESPPNPDLAALFKNPLQLTIYRNREERDAVGMLAPLTRIPWGVVIEKSYQETFAEVARLRTLSIVLAALLLAVFGSLAYLVAQGILHPLRLLTDAAGKVAAGDLEVRLAVKNSDELGFATEVFNDMVFRLRTSREELKRLAVIDPLTGLATRGHLMDMLTLQFERYRRSGSRFSILMIDIDHFKRINDRFGHLAGDAALEQTGGIFRELLRSVDTAGRYGGEEFLIILEQADSGRALQTAERIRREMEQRELRFEGRSIRFTLSIGIATVGDNGEASSDDLIRRADQALYRAKQRGRNCVVPSSGGLQLAVGQPSILSRQ